MEVTHKYLHTVDATPALWVRGCIATAISLLFLATTLVPAGAFGHAGLHEEIEQITLQIEQTPANPQLYNRRGEIYRANEDWDNALADFRKARALDATDTRAELGLGRTLLERGVPQQALAHLNIALARQPGNVRTLVTRAQTYRALDKPLAAAADYNHAIELFPAPGRPLPEYYLERARAYVAAGDAHIGTALQGLDEGLQVLGDIRTLALYAVALEQRRGDFDAALVRLDQILAGATRKEFLLLERGDILLAASRSGEAREAFLAARTAIDSLPARHRHTRTVQQLEAALANRLEALQTEYGQ